MANEQLLYSQIIVISRIQSFLLRNTSEIGHYINIIAGFNLFRLRVYK